MTAIGTTGHDPCSKHIVCEHEESIPWTDQQAVFGLYWLLLLQRPISFRLLTLGVAQSYRTLFT